VAAPTRFWTGPCWRLGPSVFYSVGRAVGCWLTRTKFYPGQRKRWLPLWAGDRVVAPGPRQDVFIEEAMSETTVPTAQPSSSQTARVPPPHGRQGGPGCHQGAPPEGPPPSGSLTWKTRRRATFQALRKARTVRSGPLLLSWAPAPAGQPPCLGYAIGKKTGNAVVRNRLRRRLREAARRSPGLPPGIYLIRARPEAAGLTFHQLLAHLQRAATAVRQAPGGTPGRPRAQG
jgi:ribonuclease P protein component